MHVGNACQRDKRLAQSGDHVEEVQVLSTCKQDPKESYVGATDLE
jgi:hypothetical protein